MSDAKITIFGLENYLSGKDDSLFTGVTFPEGIDRDLAINTIMLRANEFELLYHEPTFFKFAIANWANKHRWTFEKWSNALTLEYDPISNYDRTETSTITHAGTSTDEGSSSSSTESSQGSDISTTAESTGINAKASLNAVQQSNEFTNTDKNTADTTTTSSEDSSGSSSSTSESSYNKTDNYTDTTQHRAFGNIGVTTSQQMLESEFNIARFNVYEEIANLFIDEFCLLVY